MIKFMIFDNTKCTTVRIERILALIYQSQHVDYQQNVLSCSHRKIIMLR